MVVKRAMPSLSGIHSFARSRVYASGLPLSSYTEPRPKRGHCKISGTKEKHPEIAWIDSESRRFDKWTADPSSYPPCDAFKCIDEPLQLRQLPQEFDIFSERHRQLLDRAHEVRNSNRRSVPIAPARAAHPFHHANCIIAASRPLSGEPSRVI